jgi:predicted ATPase
MPLSSVEIEGYRSLRSLQFPVEQLSVFVGRNGVGKTNLYRALHLLQCAAAGSITRAIMAEGGIGSVLWAGPRRRKEPVRLRLGARLEQLGYRIEVGLPRPTEAALPLEPMVKEEELSFTAGARPAVLMLRKGATVWLTDDDGRRQVYEGALLPSETALASFQDQSRFPELFLVRRELAEWRFYHDFPSGAGSAIRSPCLAVATPTLSSDGHDLAAVLETVRRIRQDATEIDAAVADAFPGARLLGASEGGRCTLAMDFPDMPRPLEAHELSDGTLKYLCLVGALSGYRLPALVALNEPEASLHEELIAPLARLILDAARRAQLWIVTHSSALAGELECQGGARPRHVIKEAGATRIEDRSPA